MKHLKNPFYWILLFFLLPGLLNATVGGPLKIRDIHYDPVENRVLFIEEPQGGEGLPAARYVKYNGDENKEVSSTVFGSVFDFSSANLDEQLDNFRGTFFEKSEQLKEIDLQSINMTFQTDISDIKISNMENIKSELLAHEQRNPQISKQDLLNYESELIGIWSKAYWGIKVIQNDNVIDEYELTSCLLSFGSSQNGQNMRQKTFRAYSLPDLDFIVLVANTVDICFETGYTADHLRVIKKVDLTGAKFIDQITDYNYADDISQGGVSMELGDDDYYFLLNNKGFQAYKSGDYNLAMILFEKARTDDYIFPLFNLAATQALVGLKEQSLDNIEILLRDPATFDHYKQKIINDSDFDTIRNNVRYDRLLHEGDQQPDQPGEDQTSDNEQTDQGNNESTNQDSSLVESNEFRDIRNYLIAGVIMLILGFWVFKFRKDTQ